MTESAYIKAVRAEIRRLDWKFGRRVGPLFLRKRELGLARLAKKYFLTNEKTQVHLIDAVIIREMQVKGKRVDPSELFMTRKGMEDPVLTEGDQTASVLAKFEQ